jgi:diguanylate cyclase (GGDEF)-like protein/PAS domain S-box-containing protein
LSLSCVPRWRPRAVALKRLEERLSLVPARAARALQGLSMRMALTVAAGATCILALSFALYFYLLEHEQRELTGKQLFATATRAAADIDARLAQRKRALEAAAFSLFTHPRALDPRNVEAFLADQNVLGALFDAVLFIDADGKLVADRPRVAGLRGVDVGDRDYFAVARDTGRIAVSAPIKARVGNYAVVMFGVPVLDPQGRFGGVLAGALQLHGNAFFADIRDARIGDSGYFSAFSKSGVVLMHRDSRRIMEPIATSEQNPALHEAIAGWNGWATGTGRRGVEAVRAYRSLSQAPWIVAATLPADEAFAPLTQVWRLAWGVGAAAAFFLALFVWLVATSSLAPLTRLRHQVQELESGVRTGAVDTGGAVEIARVAHAFNRLLEKDRRLAEALAQREAFHRSLTETTPLGIFVQDPNNQCIYVNRRLEELLGRSFMRLRGQGWLDDVHPEDRERVERDWLASFAEQKPHDCKLRLLVDGGTRWVHLRAQPLRDDGSFAGYVGAVADITTEREAEFALEREKARNDRVLQVIEEALFVVDVEGRVMHMSAAAERLTGCRRDDVAGMPLVQLVRLKRERDGAVVDLASKLALDRFDGDDCVCHTIQHAELPVDVTWTRVGDAAHDAGTVDLGGVLVIRDATERRAAARKAQWDANHDMLTRLANRRAFEQSLEDARALFRNNGVNSALILLDLDHFKQVNDLAGHDAGDEMLVKVARCLADGIRGTDVSARLGGDEFGLLLHGCGLARAVEIAEAVRSAICALRVKRGEHVLRVGVTQGVSVFAEEDLSIGEIKRRADAACYRAKTGGRGTIEHELPASAMN